MDAHSFCFCSPPPPSIWLRLLSLHSPWLRSDFYRIDCVYHFCLYTPFIPSSVHRLPSHRDRPILFNVYPFSSCFFFSTFSMRLFFFPIHPFAPCPYWVPFCPCYVTVIPLLTSCAPGLTIIWPVGFKREIYIDLVSLFDIAVFLLQS